MPDIFDMPLADIIKEKILRKEKEIVELRQQFRLITGSDLDTLKNSTIIDFRAAAERLNSTSNSSAALENNVTYKTPSLKSLKEKILSYLKENNRLIKTNELVTHFYPNIEKSSRLVMTRKFSLALNLLRTDNKIFSKKGDGERGDFYTVNKYLIEQNREIA